jgi:hypothetical protein
MDCAELAAWSKPTGVAWRAVCGCSGSCQIEGGDYEAALCSHCTHRVRCRRVDSRRWREPDLEVEVESGPSVLASRRASGVPFRGVYGAVALFRRATAPLFPAAIRAARGSDTRSRAQRGRWPTPIDPTGPDGS